MNIEPEQIREKPFFNIDHLIFLFFSYKGRVNRKRYLLSGLLLAPICFLAKLLSDSYFIISLPLLIFIAYTGLMISIKRAHDINKSGYYFLWLLVPGILSLGIGPLLLYVPTILSLGIGFWFLLKLLLSIIPLWPAIKFMFFKGTLGDNRFGADMLPPRNGPEHTAERAEEHSFSRAGPEVKGTGYLGIYLSKDGATVVCIDSQGRDRKVLGCFSVSVPEQEEQNEQVLARLIAEGCAERELTFSEVVVALDCAMFMQHNVHSEFKDPKQVAATVRFDTEEALSTDISDVAIAFRIMSSGDSGSELTVFTAQQKVLSDVLLSLQGNNIDPISVEPDIYSLSRFISHKVFSPQDSHCLFGLLSGHSGYFLAFGDSQQVASVRTFLINPAQDRGALLAREVPLTIALAGSSEAINCLKLCDSKQSVNHQQLGEKLGIQCGDVELIGSVAADEDILGDCSGPVDFAIAYGAALAHLDKVQSVNFRNDFMPHQGKKIRMQKALKFLSVSVSLLIAALGMYVTAQLWRTNKDRALLRKAFKPDYVAVMLGEKVMPKKSSEVKKRLERERRRVRRKNRPEDKESAVGKLALVLEAFNKCAKPTKLEIDKIAITSANIRIEGSTSSEKNTIKLLNEIGKKMTTTTERLAPQKGVRHNFSITVQPKT